MTFIVLSEEAHFWRSTTISLMTRRRRPSPLAELSNDDKAEMIEALGTRLLEVLQPMRRRRSNDERCLEKFAWIATEVAQLGLKLVEQPHPIQVDWSPPPALDERGRQLILFPGLKQYRLDFKQEVRVRASCGVVMILG
ncbi:hypothetical protein PG984_002647 [Apiospora sp. TS-2023a]